MSMWASQFFSFRCCKKTFKHIGKVLRGPLIQRAKDKLNLDFGLFFICKTCTVFHQKRAAPHLRS